MNITTLTAAQILAISILEPERLFSRDEDDAKLEWRKLSRAWHPDMNPTADPAVLSHINALYDEALRKVTAGSWKVPGLFSFKTTKGKEFGLRYKKHRPFELGDVYIAEKLVAYAVHRDNEDLYREAKRRLTSLAFHDKKMEDEVRRYLPKISDEQVTKDQLIMVVEKTPDVFCLADVLNAAGSKLDPKHVAWVISALLNIKCYLKYANITHNDISLETVFISPEHHSVMLLGGWWYSRPRGEKLLALPARTMNDYDPSGKPKARHELDMDLIKLTGRELLGDATGSALLREKLTPPMMLSWLRSPGSDNVFDEYKLWYNKILKESFGARRFIKLELTAKEIYAN